MAGINHLHSDEPQPNLRRRCSRQVVDTNLHGHLAVIEPMAGWEGLMY